MATERARFVIDEKGKKTAVILPIRRYRELIEDLYDIELIEKRRGEPRIPWEELKEPLREDGVLPD